MTIRLIDIASVIRSKNAGPYELTLDIIFKTREWCSAISDNNLINTNLIAEIYRIPIEDVLGIIEFEPACAIKITIRRPIVSGAIGDTDVYGAQQHAPLLGLTFNTVIHAT